MKPTYVSGLLSLQTPSQNPSALVTHTTAHENYLTIQEVADLLRINIRTVYRLNKKGELPKVKIGHSVMYPLSLLQETIRTRALSNLSHKDW